MYISGYALVILGGPHDLIQTIYHDDYSTFDAVTIDDSTGKIAVCTTQQIYIYRPYGKNEGLLRVFS